MGKKNRETPIIRSETPKSATRIRIVNLTGKTFPVPYRGPDGKTVFLNLRLQTGRHGQDAPVLPQSAIVPEMKALERKGFVRIENV
jgi:hypothetical protein